MTKHVSVFVVSTLPPEYIEYAGKGIDVDECKKWLKESHPGMYDELYPAVEDEDEESAAAAG